MPHVTRQLFFHIGPHKTGTTYIQETLAAHAAELAQLGVGYDLSRESSGFAHHDIADELVKGGDLVRSGIQRLLANLGDAPKAVISSEVLSRVSRDVWGEVLAALPGDVECCFIVYLRSRSAALYSQWQELVKHGAVWSLREYLGEQLLFPYINPQINLRSVIDRLPLGPRAQIKIVIYDNLISASTDLVNHFLSQLVGVELPRQIGTGQVVNAAFDITFLEFLRAMNMISLRKGLPVNDRFRNRLLAAMKAEPATNVEVERLRELMGKDMISIELASLDRNFQFLDDYIVERFPDAIVNPLGRAPFHLVDWPASTKKLTSNPALLSDAAVWQAMNSLHDAVWTGED